eukprot:gene5610-4030_t
MFLTNCVLVSTVPWPTVSAFMRKAPTEEVVAMTTPERVLTLLIVSRKLLKCYGHPLVRPSPRFAGPSGPHAVVPEGGHV